LFCLPFGSCMRPIQANPRRDWWAQAPRVSSSASVLVYTGSLWWAVGFHAAWDWGQSCFYGTADSASSPRATSSLPTPWKTTLERRRHRSRGSVIVIPLLLVIALLMAAWWGKRGENRSREWLGVQAACHSILRIGDSDTPGLSSHNESQPSRRAAGLSLPAENRRQKLGEQIVIVRLQFVHLRLLVHFGVEVVLIELQHPLQHRPSLSLHR